MTALSEWLWITAPASLNSYAWEQDMREAQVHDSAIKDMLDH